MASRAAALKSAKKKSSPTIKQPVKQYSVDELELCLDEYIRKVGVEAALDLGCYQSLPATFAVRGAGLVKIQGLLRVLLAVTLGATLCCIGGPGVKGLKVSVIFHVLRNPQGRLLASHVEQVMVNLGCKYYVCKKNKTDLKRFGQEWSDRFTVILGHLRRLQQPVRWNQAVQSMSDPDIGVLEGLVDLLEDELPAKKAKLPKPAAELTSILRKPLETLQKPEKNFALVNDMEEDGLGDILPEQEEIPLTQDLVSELSPCESLPKVPTSKDRIKAVWDRESGEDAEKPMKKPAAKQMKRPAAATATTESSSSGSKLLPKGVHYKATYASEKSYLQYKCPATGKFKLLVNCTKGTSPDHKNVIRAILEDKPRSRDRALQMRNFLVG